MSSNHNNINNNETETQQQQAPKQPAPGAANSSSWNDSGFAFAPNTNVMDSSSMPSDDAQKAREKSAQIMAALKSGDTERANALMGKDTTPGRLLPGMGWIKKKMNKKNANKLEGKSVGGGNNHDDVDDEETLNGDEVKKI